HWFPGRRIEPQYSVVRSVWGQTQDVERVGFGYFRSDPLLGYGPTPLVTVQARLVQGNHVVYDVLYRINGSGIRKHPHEPRSSKRAVLFFGGSYTFGEGVNDDQTLPF